MYYLPIRLRGEKVHIVPLRSSHEPADDVVPSFIIPYDPQTALTRLLTLDGDVRLVAHGGTNLDRVIDGITLHENRPDSLTLHLTVSDTQAPAEDLSDQSAHFLLEPADETESGLALLARTKDRQIPRTNALTINVQTQLDGQPYLGEIRLYLAEPHAIYDVVMDFGSEASQIVLTNRGSGQRVLERLNIVDDLLRYFYPNLLTSDSGKLTAKALHQRDPDPDLLRSVFFLRRSGAVFQSTDAPNQHGDAEYLNLLTERDRIDSLAQSHFLVSNLKLAHLGAYRFDVSFASPATNEFGVSIRRFSDTISGLQQAIVNYLLRTVLEHLHHSHPANQPFFLSVKLLVPNVFEQQRVSTLVQGTYRNLHDLMQPDSPYTLRGAEVGTLSESDAAFLGYRESRSVQRQPLPLKGRYLIVDSGKGTTDFSLIERDDETKSVFRSGFIGAGNAISYAFVETVFAAIFGPDSTVRQQAIWRIALGPTTDLVDKIRFGEVIETLKRGFDKGRNQTAYRPIRDLIGQQIQDIRARYQNSVGTAGLLKEVTDALETLAGQQESLQDEFGFINNVVKRLTDKLAQEVVYSGFYDPDSPPQVILTGRAFLFRLFAEEVSNRFGNVRLASDGRDTTALKKICLAGAFSSETINYDANLVGQPTRQVDGDAGIRLVDAGHETGAVAVLPPRPYEKLTEAAHRLKGMMSKVDGFLQKIRYEPDASSPVTTQTAPTTLQSRRPLPSLYEGVTFRNYQSSSQWISISGLRYAHPALLSPKQPTVNVFFTGTEFLLRTPTEAARLTIRPEFFQHDQFVFETLFPYLDEPHFSQVVVDQSVGTLDDTI
ncbi:hypothetical protein G8759_23750 [Spirosoma aureum]|uniref:Uncharacterized protein n=1 Tax=Spirosoma aureum TaxID=2692134 RepID=A0A6G9ASP3_9BACT|nr:hypothetical protein [Spirosoma aureum]QIP15430.1 hypothetical protein G8759_23750 [Spirosoma aureum]